MFTRETDMTDQVVSYFLAKYGEDWTATVECMSGWGVADIVLSRMDRALLEGRMSRGLAPLPEYSLCSVIGSLDSIIGQDLDDLVGRTGYSRSYLKHRLLARLVAGGYVEQRQSDGLYYVNPDWCSPVAEIVAIEMKVSHWQRAWFQAWRYLDFAERSYIAMGLRGHICDSISQSMASSDIGIVFVSPEGAETTKEAHAGGPNSPVDRLFVSETVLNRLWQNPLPDSQVVWHQYFRSSSLL
jgi:hypothetical protein